MTRAIALDRTTHANKTLQPHSFLTGSRQQAERVEQRTRTG